jgi:hypothetical protein
MPKVHQRRGDKQGQRHLRVEHDRRCAGDQRQADARGSQHRRVGNGKMARHLQQQDRNRHQGEKAFEEAHGAISGRVPFDGTHLRLSAFDQLAATRAGG